MYKAQNITPDEEGVNYWTSQLSQEGADFDTIKGHFDRTAARDSAAKTYEEVMFSPPPADMSTDDIIRAVKARLESPLTNASGQRL